MAPLARPTLPLLLVLLCAVLVAPAASAREQRFPAKGYPAFVINPPDDWTVQPEGAGTVVLMNANRQVKLVLFTGESTEPLDTVAQAALTAIGAVPPEAIQGVEISGCKGRIYFSNLRDARRAKLHLEMTVVQTDPKHIAMITLILPATVNPQDETTARTVQGKLRLRVFR